MKDVDRKLIFETYVTEISDPQGHAWSADREEGWGSMDWRKKAYDDGEQNNVNVVLSGIRAAAMKFDTVYNNKSTSHYWSRMFSDAIQALDDFMKMQKGEDLDIGSHGDIGVQLSLALGGDPLKGGESTEDAAKRQKAEQAEEVVRDFELNSINQIQILRGALGAVAQYTREAIVHEYGEVNLAGAWHVAGNSSPEGFITADDEVIDLTRSIMNGLMELESQT